MEILGLSQNVGGLSFSTRGIGIVILFLILMRSIVWRCRVVGVGWRWQQVSSSWMGWQGGSVWNSLGQPSTFLLSRTFPLTPNFPVFRLGQICVNRLTWDENTGQAAHGPAPPVADDPQKDVIVTPGQQIQAPGGHQEPGAMSHAARRVEEKVEYRDEAGNLLDPAQVQALEGKVSFSTRYETRTRLVDQDGNEIVRPSHESVEGTVADAPEPGTVGEGMMNGEERTKPAEGVKVEADVDKEGKVQREAEATAKPNAEADGALEGTGRDEL